MRPAGLIRRPQPRQAADRPGPLKRLGIKLFNAGARVLNAFGSFLATSQSESGYAAARWNRLTAEWTIWRRSADQEILADLGALRARARNLVLNNPYAKRFVSQVTLNVAGPHGVRCQPRVRDANGDLDKTTNAAIARAWAAWCRRDNCMVDGRLSFRALQRLVMSAMPQDGEILIRIVEGFNNPFGFALQLVDADLLDEQYNELRGPNGREIRMGVELDEWGRPTGYWLWKNHPSEATRDRKREFIPASQLLHLYVPFRVGQTRGVPWSHAIMLDLKQADGYAEAELIAARIAASKMGFFETKADAMGGWQPPQENIDGAERLQMEVEPGLMSELPPWLTFKSWDPQHPNQAYRDFMKAVLHGVSAGVDMCYHNLTGDLEGVSYSSARVGELDERDAWRALQQWLIEELHERVYRRWLGMAMLTNQVQLPSYNVEEYADVAWLPRGWAWVDPQNELAAIKEAIGLGLTSRQIEAAAAGRDLEDVFADLQHEQDLADEYEIDVSGVKSSAPPSAPASGVQVQDEETPAPNGNGKGKARAVARAAAEPPVNLIENHIHVPAQEPPVVKVEPYIRVESPKVDVHNRIDVPEQPAPTVQVAAPQVNVQPHVDVTADVEVPVAKSIRLERDKNGRVVRVIRE